MTEVSSIVEVVSKRVPWNKGKIVGAKPPLLISGTGWMAGIGHGQTHHSSGPTSALGHSRPKWAFRVMSAFHPLATKVRTSRDVSNVPTADILMPLAASRQPDNTTGLP